MCDSWKIPRGKELSASEVETVFSKIGSLDVVRLSGGEPFLRADLADVAEAVMRASSPGVLHLTTNGSFPARIERFAREFSRPRRLRVMVSFDGMADIHDQSRGSKVNFDRALETVERLTRLAPSGVRVSINHTIISRASLADHQALRQLMRKRGVDTQWVLAYSESSMYAEQRRGGRAEDLVVVQGYPLHPQLDLDEALAFAEAELEASGQLESPVLRVGKQYYLEGLVARLRGERHPRPKPKCVALRSHIRLLPDGDVVPCQFNTERLGNLLVQSFEELWHGEVVGRSRRWVDACSGCWAECEVVPNAIYSGDLPRHALSRHLRTTP
jgi:MoaA/NifB/PqqE/SkfB family radical SAM enzyme